MKFQTTLTPQNKKEFVKSWTSLYQTGLMQFRAQKREATDIGFIRPVTSYLVALVAGFFLLNWGMQRLASGLSGLEICFGALLLFVIALNIAYAIRPKWFGYIAGSRLLPKRTVEVVLDDNGISFREEGGPFSGRFQWSELTRVINVTNTLMLYTGEQKSYGSSKDHVLLINKQDLTREQLEAVQEKYLRPLNIRNEFKGYYSYSDIFIFIFLCLLFALAALPSLFL